MEVGKVYYHIPREYGYGYEYRDDKVMLLCVTEIGKLSQTNIYKITFNGFYDDIPGMIHDVRMCIDFEEFREAEPLEWSFAIMKGCWSYGSG